MTDKKDDEFLAHMADVRPLKGKSDHVHPTHTGRTRHTLQVISRQTSDDRLRHLSKPGEVSKSSRAIDGSTNRKLRQGKITIEARLDLHGYTQSAARTTFRRFIEGAAHTGKRCVLVITGKGAVGRDGAELVPWGHDDGRGPRGVLRTAIESWIHEAPMNHLILKISPATPKDGGPGAFYVYLRRDRGFPDT